MGVGLHRTLDVAENTAEGTQMNALIAPEYGEPVFQRMMSSEALGRYADLLLPPPVRFWFCAMPVRRARLAHALPRFEPNGPLP